MAGLEGYSKYEITRIVGARALQIAMNAPLLIKIKDEDLEKINYDALKIAEIELNSDILPISINRPFPKRKEESKKIKRNKEISDQEKEKREIKEEEEIVGEGEIMELANPEDELEEKSEEDRESEWFRGGQI